MTGEKVRVCVDELAAIVRDQIPGKHARQHDSAYLVTNQGEQYQHLLYMAEEIHELVSAGKIEKAMRWLGFMQGVLWSLSICPLDQLKRMNMPDHERMQLE